MDWEKLLEKYKLQIGVGLVGVVLVSFGALLFSISRQSGSTIEILPSESEGKSESGTIFVDLEGAVQKPGLYELPADARVNDLLIRAGGLSAEADREWVTQNLNLAQELSDGAKIYVPSSLEGQARQNSSGDLDGQVAGAGVVVASKISINSASATQLDTLWGIGEKRAADIIANRPYQTLEELKTKAKIPSHIYERIKDEVTLY